MAKPALKKVTVHLPVDVLARAVRLTQQGITQTLITALGELERKAQRSALRQLRGKVRVEMDVARTRR